MTFTSILQFLLHEKLGPEWKRMSFQKAHWSGQNYRAHTSLCEYVGTGLFPAACIEKLYFDVESQF